MAKPFSHNAMNQAMGSITFDMPPFTIHDLRRTGSTILHENGFSSDVVEKALNHTIGGVRRVYNRAEYAEQRREMLQFWGDYSDQLATENTVLTESFGQRAGDEERSESNHTATSRGATDSQWIAETVQS